LDNSFDSYEHAQAPPAPGLEFELSDRYQNLQLIGAGGAGTVYKALDKTLDKVVAIKRLHNSATEAQSVRFHREAKILAALKHPNLLNAIDFGLTQKNEPYLVLDFVQGTTLSRWLKKNGPMAVPIALAAFIDIARGLSHAHGKNVIHRDLKPSNIMLIEEEEGRKTFKARILDFGLARDTEQQDFTQPGVGIGTPKYMSPEQIEGGNVDARSDIYSFGCLMFETLTATALFEGDTVFDTIQRHLKDIPDNLTERAAKIDLVFRPPVTPNLESIIDKCLEKNPNQRFQKIDDLLEALLQEEAFFQTMLQEQSRLERTLPSDAHIESQQGKSTKRYATVAIIAVTLLAVSGIAFYGITNERPSEIDKTVRKINMRRELHHSLPIVGKSKRTLSKSSDQITSAKITDDELKKYLLDHPRSPELYLTETSVTSAGLRLLEQRPDLKLLAVTINNSEQFMANIAALKSVEKLEFTASPEGVDAVHVEHLDKLAALKNLSSLSFKGCSLDSADIKAIGKMEKLDKLTFNRCAGLRGNVLAPLQNCKRLRYLSLNHAEIDDGTLKAMPKLTVAELKLTGITKLTKDGIVSCASMPNLTRFKIIEGDRNYSPDVAALVRKRADLHRSPFSELIVDERRVVDDEFQARITRRKGQ
jgi:serine/threonine protein kinase